MMRGVGVPRDCVIYDLRSTIYVFSDLRYGTPKIRLTN
jgi:hypothetical protein